MTKMQANLHVPAQWQVHPAGTSWAVALAHSVWIPLAVAFFGAAGGGLISAWAIFRNGSKEWQRKQAVNREALQQKRAQARRALQVEMFLNARKLRTAAIMGRRISETSGAPQKTPDKLHNFFGERDFSAVFRVYFIDATEGVAWNDINYVLDAYETGEMLFEGSLVVDPIGSGWCSGSADDFCKAIRAISKYDKLEDSFYEDVKNLERWAAQHDQQEGSPTGSTS